MHKMILRWFPSKRTRHRFPTDETWYAVVTGQGDIKNVIKRGGHRACSHATMLTILSAQQISSIIIRCVFFFLSIGRESTTWPANNCLRIMVCSCVVPSKRVLLQIIFCSCVIGTTFSREKWQIASLSCQEVIKIWKQTWWSNDKTIIELCYRKISWFVSVSQINYLPRPSASANNWSARHWQMTIFCSTSSSNC